MEPSTQREINEAAYRQLKEPIAKTYRHGHFVAIFGGKIIADAATFRELQAMLHECGNDSPEVLVVQAGTTEPEYMDFLGIRL
jgi:hypothetical protein